MSDELLDRDEVLGSLAEALEKHNITPERIREVRAKATQGFIYIIKCHGYYKIGRSQLNPKKRLDGLQSGSPYKLELIFTVKISEYQTVEMLLHRHYTKEGYHIRGEWFELTDEKLKELIKLLSD